ncbi:MAG: hypothetical protein QUS33_13100 [Dehalococcoidia bacterium]|nr:hypothetical protein [Dehalococcoidia bacterium]
MLPEPRAGKVARFGLSDSDLDFVVREAGQELSDSAREKLRLSVRQDPKFRRALVGDERVFRRVVSDQDILLKISPRLYFEVLLRRALTDLEKESHTIERIGQGRIPVFDSEAVVTLLSREDVLEYLADMLSSFTRIESHAMYLRVRAGVWRTIRFSDIDIDALRRLCEVTAEEKRFGLYKRISDVCLFISGMFPEYGWFDYGYAAPAPPGTGIWRWRWSIQDYEEEGRRFYKLASNHRDAALLNLAGALHELHERFHLARKCLEYVSTRFLQFRKEELFRSPDRPP